MTAAFSRAFNDEHVNFTKSLEEYYEQDALPWLDNYNIEWSVVLEVSAGSGNIAIELGGATYYVDKEKYKYIAPSIEVGGQGAGAKVSLDGNWEASFGGPLAVLKYTSGNDLLLINAGSAGTTMTLLVGAGHTTNLSNGVGRSHIEVGALGQKLKISAENNTLHNTNTFFQSFTRAFQDKIKDILSN